MFRGFDRSQSRMVFAILIAMGAGLVALNGSRSTTAFQQPARPGIIDHAPGQLINDAPGGGALPEARKDALTGQIDLNTATAAELDSLPGVGESRAAAILAERQRAPYSSVADLKRVPGFGAKTIEALAPYVRVDDAVAAAQSLPMGFDDRVKPRAAQATPLPPTPTPRVAPPVATPISRVRINSGNIEELMLLDGIGEVLAGRIADYRWRYGPFRRAEDLMKVKGIGPKTFERNRHLISLE